MVPELGPCIFYYAYAIMIMNSENGLMEKKNKILPIGRLSFVFLIFSLISGFLLGANDSLADNTATIDLSIGVPMACTMAGDVASNHTAEIENGIYRAGIGVTTFRAICNDHAGFSVYAIGFSDDTMGNNNLVARVGGELSPSNDIATGTATSGNLSNWAMMLTPVAGTNAPTIMSDNDGSFSNYHVVPASYTKVATFSSGTAGSEGSTFTSTYAAYIAPTQPSGVYGGKVKYSLIHPANESAPPEPQPSTAGCINYFANAANAEGTMGCQSANDEESIDLLASNFSREGYGFAGWSNKYDYATNTDSDLKFYGPQETITVPEGTTAHGLSLYAIWIKSQGSLQDSTKVASLCGTGPDSLTQAPTDGTANLSSVSALTDQRDNQTYAIAKLADGKCWMIENLRLEAEDSRGNNRFNPSITNESLAQGYNPSFIGLANPESASFSNVTVANSLYSIDGSTEKTISGDNQGRRFPRYNNFNTNQRASSITSANANIYSYGNYYTWAAVIADTAHYSSGDHNVTSICPKGWRIPQGNNTNEGFGRLDIDMGGTGVYQSTNEASNRWRSYPVNILYSGALSGSRFDYLGDRGYYWSSTAYNDGYSYLLFLYNSNLYPGATSFYKYGGSNVRCVAE